MPDTRELELSSYQYLASLNEAQLRAVTAPPDVPLQILAGPGSGKTRVLTSRVAHLVRQHKYEPHQITAVTFTNKAAAEMRKRLKDLLGEKQAGELVLGTFHATCARFLRRYGSRISLDPNYAIADADDCKKIMARLFKDRADELKAMQIQLQEGAVLSEISKAKARGESPEGMMIRAAQEQSSTSVLVVISELYYEYEDALREAGALDFDDLLLYALKLFRRHPNVLSSCRHVLVDEFQDTNVTQYELMLCFAKAHGGVSIVGDPDQSIYGWRAAEVENLHKMTREFENVQAIYLEENYRSTGSILAASHSIVSQDKKRIQKKLFTSHHQSTPVTLKSFEISLTEADFIAFEIKRLIAYSGGTLNYDDFAILLRYNALSRGIESALQKEGIPNRIIGGHKFFERMEIKDLLAYLQLADNPGFTPAFMRVVNVPKRGIGDKSLADLVIAARKAKISLMEMAERITDGGALPSGIKPGMKRNLAAFVSVVRKLRREALKGTPVHRLILLLVDLIHYEDYLRASQPDFDQRWENVKELINYSVIVAKEYEKQVQVDVSTGFLPAGHLAPPTETAAEALAPQLHPMFRGSRSGSSDSRAGSSKADRKPRVKVEGDVVVVVDSDDEESSPEPDQESSERLTPLRHFLQASMLSTDTESSEDEAKTPKVTISTIHSSKGLEWPVVFLPVVEEGTIPFYKCVEEHEVAEERRLLYVAMTRAQVFLVSWAYSALMRETLTYSRSRMLGGDEMDRDLSPFVALTKKKEPTLFSSSLPTIDVEVRRRIAGRLGRPVPDEAETDELVKKHLRSAPPLRTWETPEPSSRGMGWMRGISARSRGWPADPDDSLPSAQVSGFSSALYANGHKAEPMSPVKAEPKPPPQRIQSANRHLPAALPFLFETDVKPARPQPTLNSFAKTHLSSLSAMKNLGLPPEAPGTGEPQERAGEPQQPSTSSRTAPLPRAPIPLARGTKRLGMGRPTVQWGDPKRPKK